MRERTHPIESPPRQHRHAAPKLSICVITYNRAEYLRQTLLDHASLDGVPFAYEIVVVDNCSTDGTPEVLAQFASAAVSFRWFRQSHTVRPEENLIAAFRLARGEFAVYLADDDALIPARVAAVVTYMDQNPAIVACHSPWDLLTR
jgi:glycosyltransferase involved in cell wall biosynthesis